MTVMVQGDQLRTINFGNRAEKSTGTLAASTIPLFTIAGGLVAVTSLVGRVTTSVTVANSYKLQHNPTGSPTTVDLCAATDIGTTDTIAGEILVVSGVRATGLSVGANPRVVSSVIMDVGQIESVSAGTDGVILWICTWVPLDNGASLVAA
jgi:hypothetical protein